ncbi:DUF4303 domain-containing protein [Anaeromyxobacter sp. SG66]|uniref:DUF4303 domain-containing protein n=1 Tax=Anaeromyxobacter sp. SG66 TaxID=2925410 RepID=UPI001F588302|nr:DUF4303 domain-containing protein [Anaeromyxobacter sp. SG66]
MRAPVHVPADPAAASFDLSAFRRALTDRTAAAVRALRERIGSETLYAFALYTDAESGYASVRASANTEEGLARAATARAADDPRFRGEAGRRLLRWSAADWDFHDFDAGVREVALPDPAGRRESLDRAILTAMVGALRSVDRAGLFGRGADRAFLTVNVLCPHPSRAFFVRNLRALNPVPTVERHLRETDAAPLVRAVNRAPRRERMRIWLALYEDLYMEWKTPIAEEARARGMSPWDVEAELVKFGPKVVPKLLDLLAHYGFAPPFDSARELETREVWLAGSALFLVRRIGAVPEGQIHRMQTLVAAFVERDRRLKIASTLAENTARVLHELRPRRFPESVMDPQTYKLLNPEPFLPRRR